MLIKVKGYPSAKEVKMKFPEEPVLIKPKAIIECYQEIPCNPCETSCPFEAITIGDDINQMPMIDFDKCTGCGVCVHSCPGLAIMVAQVKQGRAYYKIPYEMLPRPNKGDVWDAVNRKGDVIGKAQIEHVLLNKQSDRTAILTVSTDKRFLYDFVTVRCPDE